MVLRAAQRQRAFTIIELLVVILIIGLLLAVAAPSFLNHQERAKDSAAKQSLAIAGKNAKLAAKSNGDVFPAAAALQTQLSASEPGLTFSTGSIADADVDKEVVVDINSTPTALLLHTRSASGRKFTATSTTVGAYGLGRYPAVVIEDDPVSYWRLSDPVGDAVDYGGEGNTGAYTGGPLRSQPGALLGDTDLAAGFDGVNDTVAVPSNSSLNPTTALTVEAWVRPDNTFAVDHSIAQKDTQYTLRQNGTYLQGYVYTGGAWRTVTAASAVVAGQWNHYAMTYDNANIRIYRNGVEVGVTPNVGAVYTTTNPLHIGSVNGSTNFFDGSLDEVAIYSRALTPAEVAEHYDAGTGR